MTIVEGVVCIEVSDGDDGLEIALGGTLVLVGRLLKPAVIVEAEI